MFDLQSMRDQLATHYDLAPNPALAEKMADVYARMDRVVNPVEWVTHAPYVAAILELKKQRNAVILAHNYMTPEIYHGISDVVGDSLQLAIEATKVEADVIVKCGVHFMAEPSKTLSPGKTVLIPDREAGCSLAESITAEGVEEMRRRYPGAPVVTYVNTTAEV
ncbi:MAG: quinolinate synthase NadA, partial [Leisingera sp.]